MSSMGRQMSRVYYSYFKYWLEAKFYLPVDKFFKDFFETSFGGKLTDRSYLLQG